MKRAAPEQQAARVNVDDATWRRFRVLALEADRSIADYLGKLVRDELRRARQRQPASVSTDASSSPEGAAGGEAAGRATGERRGASRRVRLSDFDVLTELPGPDRHRADRSPNREFAAERPLIVASVSEPWSTPRSGQETDRSDTSRRSRACVVSVVQEGT